MTEFTTANREVAMPEIVPTLAIPDVHAPGRHLPGNNWRAERLAPRNSEKVRIEYRKSARGAPIVYDEYKA
jgi:hypothetical protein